MESGITNKSRMQDNIVRKSTKKRKTRVRESSNYENEEFESYPLSDG